MFSCENISFVCVANSPTVHVNGYSFRFDISYGNISFVLRTHRICKENHSCSRLLQIKNPHALNKKGGISASMHVN